MRLRSPKRNNAMMQTTRLLMGMPITVTIADPGATQDDIERIFAYFVSIDERFSTYRATSEIERINRGELAADAYSADMRTILALSQATGRDTYGYFDIARGGRLDPSGIVKGWAIQQAADLTHAASWHNFMIDAGGDLQVAGTKDGQPWRIGIRNPFNRQENVKVLALTDRGVATSGTAIRGQHIYDPFHPDRSLLEIVSITIIGPNVYEADRFATAAFAMGTRGINFIEKLVGFEGYMIDSQARATFTSGFERFVVRV